MQLQRKDWMRMEYVPQITLSVLISLSHYLMVAWECLCIRNRFVRWYFNWNNWSSYPTTLWTSTPIVLLLYSKIASTNLFQPFTPTLILLLLNSISPCSKICEVFRKINYVPTSFHPSREETEARILTVLEKKGQRNRHKEDNFKKTSNSIYFNQDAEKTCVAWNE